MDSSEGFRQFSRKMYISLESFRSNGESKLTPVEVIRDNGLLYFRTGPHKWKVKRIRRNPHVRIAPANFRGKPIRNWVEGEARVIEDKREYEQAVALFKKEFGNRRNSILMMIYRLLRGERPTTYILIKPSLQTRN